MAARCCDDAAHLLSLTPLQARAWAAEMVGAGRSVAPAGGGSQRLGASARRPDTTERRRDGANPAGGAAPPPRVSDDKARQLQRKLPIRRETPLERPKTRGIWIDKHGHAHELTSGETDFYERTKQFLTDRGIGDDRGKLMVASHVEAEFAMYMRLNKLQHETIVVNQNPCEGKWGCETILGYILPPGATLTVFGPNDFKRTYPLPPDERTDST